MKRALIVAGLLPSLAFAEDYANPQWSACNRDVQCVAIEGVCGPVAVHIDYSESAAAHFRKQRALTKCNAQFWVPKQKDARAKCWMERCQVVGKD